MFNFLTNKNQVFQYKERSVPALTRYYAICLVVLAGSAFGVYFLHSWFKISEVALKIPVDLLLFVLSFQVERNWVFGQKDKKGHSTVFASVKRRRQSENGGGGQNLKGGWNRKLCLTHDGKDGKIKRYFLSGGFPDRQGREGGALFIGRNRRTPGGAPDREAP